MSSIKVVNVNEEATEEAVEEPVEIEEATEQIEPTNEVVDNTPVEEVEKEEVKEEVKETKADTKQVQCPKCSKFMSLKNFRYRHEKLCTTEPKPVKPQAKPKGKSKPKPQPVIRQVEVEEEQPKPKPKLSQEVSNQVLKPQSAGLPSGNLPQSPNLVDASADASRGSVSDQKGQALRDFASHYQLLQNQFIQQKKEKYNNLCQSMFSSKSKKR